jgi:hypothetical protein
MKVAIVVLCGGVDVEGKGYDDLIESIRNTWAKDLPSNIDVYYNYGLIPNFNNNPKINETILVGDKIITGIEETYDNMVPKVLECFNFISNNMNYDYVFRCCCGSYIHKENLLKFLQHKPTTTFYCGVKTKFANMFFASGSGFFFSKDLINLISKNKEEILEQRVSLDDVTIGNYFYNKKIPLHGGASRTDIGDLPSTREQIMDLKCLLRHEYHYHMRHNLRGMNYLHSLYLDNKYCS